MKNAARFSRPKKAFLFIAGFILAVSISLAGKTDECKKPFTHPMIKYFRSNGTHFSMIFEHDGNWGCYESDRIVFVKDSSGNIIETFLPDDDSQREYTVEGEAEEFVYVELMRNGISKTSRLFAMGYVNPSSFVGNVYSHGELVCRNCRLENGDIGFTKIAGFDTYLFLGRGGEKGFFFHGEGELPCEAVVFDINSGRMFKATRLKKGDYIIYTGNKDCFTESEKEDRTVNGRAVIDSSVFSSPLCMNVCYFYYTYPSPTPGGRLRDADGVVLIDTSYYNSCRERSEPIECHYSKI